MIDYEKLKLADALAKKTDGFYFACDYSNKFGVSSIILCHNESYDENVTNIDDLITKLQQLTQPKPKYEAGQYVWFKNNQDKIIMASVLSAHYVSDVYRYKITTEDNENIFRAEYALFPSREALIEAQIEYWTCLKNDDLSTRPDDRLMTSSCEGEVIYKANQCLHGCKWDGILLSRNPNLGKCRECGETCYIALSNGHSENNPPDKCPTWKFNNDCVTTIKRKK